MVPLPAIHVVTFPSELSTALYNSGLAGHTRWVLAYCVADKGISSTIPFSYEVTFSGICVYTET